MVDAKKPSASDFIRQHPNLSPNEVVEAGQKAGLKFTRNLVYLVRGPRTTAAKSSAGTTAAKTAATSGSRATSDNERALARVILEVGFERAEEVIRKLRAALA